MAEYINRAELIKNLNKFAPEHYNALINHLITKQPTADVQEVKHGQWILPRKKGCVTYDEVAFKECSECGEVTFLAKTKYSQMNYCPNCGARMDGKE